MDIMTNWGYSTNEPVPDFASAADAGVDTFHAAQAAVRDYCGWHITPKISCEWIGEAYGSTVCLPALLVHDVRHLYIRERGQDWQELDANSYDWAYNGVIQRLDRCFPDGMQAVRVIYDAGYVSAPAVGMVASQIAKNAAAAPDGVSREQAGQVSIAYNQTADGVSGGISLLERDRAVLNKYKIEARA